MEQHISFVLAVFSLVSIFIVVITFFNKLKWTQEQHEKRFTVLKQDIDAVGAKLSTLTLVQQDDIKTVLTKVDAIDKAVISMTVTMSFIRDAVTELKERN